MKAIIFYLTNRKNIDKDVYYSAFVGLSELLKQGTCSSKWYNYKNIFKNCCWKRICAEEKLGIRLCLGRGS